MYNLGTSPCLLCSSHEELPWLEKGASVGWLLEGWLALTCRPGPSASCWLAEGLEAHARPAVFGLFSFCLLFVCCLLFCAQVEIR